MNLGIKIFLKMTLMLYLKMEKVKEFMPKNMKYSKFYFDCFY